MLKCSSIVQRDAEVISAKSGKDIVMINIDNGFYYGVSGAARAIWERIEKPKRISELIDELVLIYDIDRSVCHSQTLSFLEELLAERLVKVYDGKLT